MKNKKYSFFKDDTCGLYRIKALSNFGQIEKGDIGGLISGQWNLATNGDAWVYGDARVYDNAWVYGDARVKIPLAMATRSDGYTFTIVRDKDGALCIIAGGQYFTPVQANEHWKMSRGETQLGAESLLLVKHLMVMAKVTKL